MIDKKCNERVFGTWSYKDCENPAGHGKDGAYCKRHAKKHPADDAPTRTFWRAIPSRHDVEEVTATHWTATSLSITTPNTSGGNGHTYTTKRVGKYETFFDTKEEAWQWLLERQSNVIANLTKRLEEEKKQYVLLEQRRATAMAQEQTEGGK